MNQALDFENFDAVTASGPIVEPILPMYPAGGCIGRFDSSAFYLTHILYNNTAL